MLYSSLHNKIGKQAIRYTQHNHVYALLENPRTGKLEKVYLILKYDAKGQPYLVKDVSRCYVMRKSGGIINAV